MGLDPAGLSLEEASAQEQQDTLWTVLTGHPLPLKISVRVGLDRDCVSRELGEA